MSINNKICVNVETLKKKQLLDCNDNSIIQHDNDEDEQFWDSHDTYEEEEEDDSKLSELENDNNKQEDGEEEFDFSDSELEILNSPNSISVSTSRNSETIYVSSEFENNNSSCLVLSSPTTKDLDKSSSIDKISNYNSAIDTSKSESEYNISSNSGVQESNSDQTRSDKSSQQKIISSTPLYMNKEPNINNINTDSPMYESFNTILMNRLKTDMNSVTSSIDNSNISSSIRSTINNSTSESDKRHSNFDEECSEDEEVIVNFLEKSNELAEARLAARRQARAEAREIRMRELERQQKEQEQNADRVFDMQSASSIDPLSRSRIVVAPTPAIRGNSMSSRRSSEDSLEEEGRSLRDLRHEIKDVEERFRKAMIANAQLDNERSSQSYQIQLLKDKLEEMEEAHSQLQREYKDKCRDHDALKRNNDKLTEELKLVQGQLNERDSLISEQGLVIVLVEDSNGKDARRALVSVENAHLLETTQGSLDVRLKKFAEEKKQLQNDVHQLQQQLTDARTQGRRSGSINGPLGEDDLEDVQREANKLIADYKYKFQKAEQEIASLQASLARSETQVIRYKSTAEAAEKAEGELKIERRKLQRENREAAERVEELETANNHLIKRLDKLKNAKSALLKEL